MTGRDARGSSPAILIIGAGPGVSGAVARRFARDGYDVGLVGIDDAALRGLAAELESYGAQVSWEAVDLTDVDAAEASISGLARAVGRVDVLHFNPSAFRERNPLELRAAELLADVALGVGALLTAVQAARPWMRTGGRVTVTGSVVADSPWSRAASLGVQKAGVRNLVHSLDAALRVDGIRAVSITVQGSLAEGGPFAPDRVAEAIHAAAHRDPHWWTSELSYTG